MAGDAVRVGDRPFFLDDGSAFNDFAFLGLNPIRDFLGQEGVDRLPNDGFGVGAVPIAEPLVDDDVAQVQVLDDNGARRGLDDGPESLLAPAQRLLGPLALGDVVDDRADGDTFAVRTGDGKLLRQDVAGDAVRVGDRPFFLDDGSAFNDFAFLGLDRDPRFPWARRRGPTSQ